MYDTGKVISIFFVLLKQVSSFKISLTSYPFFDMSFWSYHFEIYDPYSRYLETEFTSSEATQGRSHSTPK
jgi:hypothetical protein